MKNDAKLKNVPKTQGGELTLQEETVDQVMAKVKIFTTKGELDLPENYSAGNALKAAWLIMQTTVDKNKKPVLEVCTKASIANCMLNMVIQGLNPNKKQCYFVAYGKILTLMPSYQGQKAVCLRVDPSLLDIFSEVIYQGDEISYKIHLGQRIIVDHIQKFENIDGSKIIGAYAIAIDRDWKPRRTELMTLDEIKMAWSQSPIKPVTDKGHIKADSTHAKFSAEMAKKTVTNRLAKHIIGSSSDENLIKKAALATVDDAAKAQAQAEVDEHANMGDVIDVEPTKPTEITNPQVSEKKPARDPKPEKVKVKPKSEPEPKPEPEKTEFSEDEKEEIRAAEIAAAEEEADRQGSGKPPF
jgi:recombination protein RecT